MAKKKILVAEDDKPHQIALKKRLEKEDFDLYFVDNGEKAFKKALEAKPDLVVLDIIMPEMDGLEVLHHLREDTVGKTLKVVMLSNMADDQRILEAKKLGVEEYLVKSDVSLDELVTKLKSFVA